MLDKDGEVNGEIEVNRKYFRHKQPTPIDVSQWGLYLHPRAVVREGQSTCWNRGDDTYESGCGALSARTTGAAYLRRSHILRNEDNMNPTPKGEKIMANLDQYRAVLEDLEKQKNEYLFKVREVDVAIAALRKLMPDEPRPTAAVMDNLLPVVVEQNKYAGMSVRWAILCLLTEDAVAPLSTGAVAQLLTEGGITSTSKNFAANVSAVLSDMNHNKNEVISRDNGWVISERGKSAWIHIKANRERTQPIAFETPSVQ